VKSILFIFGGELGSFKFDFEENVGMPGIYRFVMDYEYQEKKKELYKLKYIVFEYYILCFGFHKIFFV
jgi:hypothetical protein